MIDTAELRAVVAAMTQSVWEVKEIRDHSGAAYATLYETWVIIEPSVCGLWADKGTDLADAVGIAYLRNNALKLADELDARQAELAALRASWSLEDCDKVVSSPEPCHLLIDHKSQRQHRSMACPKKFAELEQQLAALRAERDAAKKPAIGGGAMCSMSNGTAEEELVHVKQKLAAASRAGEALRAALTEIRQWDMLNPVPGNETLADHDWLVGKIDAALLVAKEAGL